MNNKVIQYTPLIILVMGILFGIMVHDNKPAPYYFGFGIGLVLLTMIPACLFSLVHWLAVRKDVKPEVVDNYDVLDSDKTPTVIKNYWYYCVRYQAVIGGFLFIVVLANQGKFN